MKQRWKQTYLVPLNGKFFFYYFALFDFDAIPTPPFSFLLWLFSFFSLPFHCLLCSFIYPSFHPSIHSSIQSFIIRLLCCCRDSGTPGIKAPKFSATPEAAASKKAAAPADMASKRPGKDEPKRRPATVTTTTTPAAAAAAAAASPGTKTKPRPKPLSAGERRKKKKERKKERKKGGEKEEKRGGGGGEEENCALHQ